MSDQYPFSLRVDLESCTEDEMTEEYRRLNEYRIRATREGDPYTSRLAMDNVHKILKAHDRRFGKKPSIEVQLQNAGIDPEQLVDFIVTKYEERQRES